MRFFFPFIVCCTIVLLPWESGAHQKKSIQKCASALNAEALIKLWDALSFREKQDIFELADFTPDSLVFKNIKGRLSKKAQTILEKSSVFKIEGLEEVYTTKDSSVVTLIEESIVPIWQKPETEKVERGGFGPIASWVQVAISVFEKKVNTGEIENSTFGHIEAFDYDIVILTTEAKDRILGASIGAVVQGYEITTEVDWQEDNREVTSLPELEDSYPTHSDAEQAGADLSQDISWSAGALMNSRFTLIYEEDGEPHRHEVYFEWTGW